MLPKEPLFNPTFLNLEYLFFKVLQFFRLVVDFFGINFFGKLFFLLKVILVAAGIFFIAIYIYSKIKINKIKKGEKKKLHEIIFRDPEPAGKNDKWEKISEHIKSNNPADWRLAIIEADTILDEMVATMEYKGENLGERMKQIEQSDFLTLNEAWEAHKVRNRIAHDGSSFVLDHKEAKRIIDLYEKVFREFDYI